MELRDAIRRRRMVRSFTGEPLAAGQLDALLDLAIRAPSAGFSQGWAFLALEGPEDVARFWAATYPEDERAGFRWPGLFRAAAIVVPLSHKQAYLDRYAEPDKGWEDRAEERWPVPYWHIDVGMATENLLLGVVDAGLGALFFGIFPNRLPAFRETFEVPEAYTPIGAVAIGHPDGGDERSPSLARGRRGLDEVVHRGRFRG